ncbi:hypothetical protein [Sanyastnella coralliicola]|uniref:hypothetical protein n=1 Tax=Sanyastnella coralliicola TaxID=3069118 RepID=UPI0027B91723|nr:hypothetical protein [Longitalea sp. SCSIO 12813]
MDMEQYNKQQRAKRENDLRLKFCQKHAAPLTRMILQDEDFGIQLIEGDQIDCYYSKKKTKSSKASSTESQENFSFKDLYDKASYAIIKKGENESYRLENAFAFELFDNQTAIILEDITGRIEWKYVPSFILRSNSNRLWQSLSRLVDNIPTAEVYKYRYKFDWRNLCANSRKTFTVSEGLFKEFNTEIVNELKQFILFDLLTLNPDLEYSDQLFTASDKWDVKFISGNHSFESEFLQKTIENEHAEWTSSFDKVPKEKHELERNRKLYSLPYWDYRFSFWHTRDKKSLSPSISSNCKIKWSHETCKKYFSKIDPWQMTYSSFIDERVATLLEERLFEICVIDVQQTRRSDDRDRHYIWQSGWHNLFQNGNAKLSFDYLCSIQDYEVSMIEYEGDASTGHFPFIKNYKLGSIMTPGTLTRNVTALDIYSEKLSTPELINRSFIHPVIFESIIKPDLIEFDIRLADILNLKKRT